jgi:hypothetical protein
VSTSGVCSLAVDAVAGSDLRPDLSSSARVGESESASGGAEWVRARITNEREREKLKETQRYQTTQIHLQSHTHTHTHTHIHATDQTAYAHT